MASELSEALSSPDSADDWCHCKSTVYNAAAEVIGYHRKRHTDCVDDNDVEARATLDDMHAKHLAWTQEKNNCSKKQVYLKSHSVAQRCYTSFAVLVT